MITQAEARKKAAKLKVKIKSGNSDDHERTLFDWENPKEKFMSPALKAKKNKGYTWQGPTR